ncbi:MAG: Rpn family recombination-promoting nuclease/putative transposase [Defluviitaleaceae bacterium]|nr:Rpn family recombination-promoting nuclease/putative transposase [Defluviitaleaceae bacterium]
MTIDFDKLMDLRVDYAFKLLFIRGKKRLLISLLNAIFANKGIHRKITWLRIKNPYLEKDSKKGKLSILDIAAKLSNGSIILIEIHLHELVEIKAKTIRSWAVTHGTQLRKKEKYSSQPPTIAITFTNGQIKTLAADSKPKIHRLCKITDIETGEILTNAMELHYIDMQAFLAQLIKLGGLEKMQKKTTLPKNNNTETLNNDLIDWLSLMLQKDIEDKNIIKAVYERNKDVKSAIDTLVWQSEDEYARASYIRRQNDLINYETKLFEAEEGKKKAERKSERDRRKIEQLELKNQEEQQKREQAEQLAAEQAHQIAMLLQKVAEQGITL